MTTDTRTNQTTADDDRSQRPEKTGGLIFVCEDSPASQQVVGIEAEFPSWQFASAPGLCHDSALVGTVEFDNAIDRAIFALCRGRHSQNEFRSRARRAGIETFGVQFVELPANSSDSVNEASSITTIRGAIARAEAFPGARPENTKTVFSNGGGKISRRALFTIPPIEYRPVPTITSSICIAGAGCNQCEKACPHDVLKNVGGTVEIDGSACSSCGICVSACPQRAVEFPGYSPAEIERQVDAVLAAKDAGPHNIVFACSKSSEMPSDEFRIIPVACTAMVPAAALLSTLAAGAKSVAVLRCKEQCRQKASPGVKGRAEYTRQILEALGEDPERVLSMPTADSGLPFAVPTVSDPLEVKQEAVEIFGRTAAASSVLRLSDRSTGQLKSFVHEYSPIGIPRIDSSSCTMCGTCDAVCPTGALRQVTDDHVELSLDVAMCIACGECVDNCPENAAGAITLELRTDIAALTGGVVVLNRDDSVICTKCNKPFTSALTLNRMKELLGDAFSYELYGKLCPDCRALG